MGVIASCKQPSAFELKTGDILFQDIDCGPYCESIESVTQGIDGAHLSHCGVVLIENDQTLVIEAISKGVSLTSLDSFLNRSADANKNPKVLVGRVNSWNKVELNEAIDRAKLQLNKPYDGVYALNDSALYCSELVYFAYLQNGKPIFQPKPMTFKAANSNELFPIWVDYFKDLNYPVPQGEPGLNPGGLSTSNFVEIVHVYGIPEGYSPSVN